MTCTCIIALGYFALAYFVYKILRSASNIIFPYLFAVPQNLKVLAGAEWACITGSTDGIGKAYAIELAKKNFNIVLISRTQGKLDEVAKEIKEANASVHVKTIVFDFTNTSLADYEGKIFSVLDKLEIGMLVNNVGMSYEYPERLHMVEGGLKRVADITTINTYPSTVLCAFVLKQMAERNSGVIVNVSSSAANHPLFYWAVYSATKKYLSWLTTILRKEYANTDIVIQTILPCFVATKMSKIRKTSFFTLNPEQFVKQAIRSIGLADETTGCLPHQLQVEMMSMVPDFVISKLIANHSIDSRERALKKKEREGKEQ